MFKDNNLKNIGVDLYLTLDPPTYKLNISKVRNYYS